MNEQSHFWISLFQWICSFSSIRKNIMLYLKMCFIFLAKNISEILWRNFCVKSQFSSYHLKQSKQEKKYKTRLVVVIYETNRYRQFTSLENEYEEPTTFYEGYTETTHTNTHTYTMVGYCTRHEIRTPVALILPVPT